MAAQARHQGHTQRQEDPRLLPPATGQHSVYFTTYFHVLTLCQATAVWVSQEAPPAKQYKSSQLVAQLSLALHDFILLRTGDTRCSS